MDGKLKCLCALMTNIMIDHIPKASARKDVIGNPEALLLHEMSLVFEEGSHIIQPNVPLLDITEPSLEAV